MTALRSTRRRWLVPEVVQTSGMDCGPASLKALLGGFGIPLGYGRLREACQTHIDGTSIDTLEEVAQHFGLDAEQVMVPVDHLLLSAAGCLPAIVIVRLPSGEGHFVVAWRRHRDVVQVMDPGTGRRWARAKRFLTDVLVHEHVVSAEEWRAWAASDEFLIPLRHRLTELGAKDAYRSHLVTAALADPAWRGLATLDAAIRAVTALVTAGALRRGSEAARVVERWASTEPRATAIDDAYWFVRPAPDDEDGRTRLVLRGAVLVRARGLLADRRTAATMIGEIPELAAAASEPAPRPLQQFLGVLRDDGLAHPLVLLGAAAAAAAGVVIEAVLLRALFHLGQDLGLAGQRIGAMLALVTFAAALLALDWAQASALLRLGRRAEIRLRTALLAKLPRLSDRYFQSRPISDMAERGHSMHVVRTGPVVGGRLVRLVCEAAFTLAGIVWLAPSLAPIAGLAAALAVVLPLAVQPHLVEQDLRVRTHEGGLARFYLDALLGLVTVRTHGAEPAVRREHEGLLTEWARASSRLVRSLALLEGVHAALGYSLAALLLVLYVRGTADAANVLLLAYWALNLPLIGQEIAAAAWRYPALRNVLLRILELLGTVEETTSPAGRSATSASEAGGVTIAMHDVTVRAGGHDILRNLSLTIAAGSQVAIVGSSGAGKSSLVGVLLGWHRPASGAVRIDGVPLDATRLDRLRTETAWIDPTVHLWNRSLLDNLCYGALPHPPSDVAKALDVADLGSVVARLPDGMTTCLGESGTLVSGGEGQRVRLGRALLRPQAKLVVLDEPFRGLDREHRRVLMARLRTHWPDATVLCVTHDVSDTLTFPRVLVVEAGRIVEDGVPTALAADPSSRYAALLQTEDRVRRGLWAGDMWRHIWVEGGTVRETGPEGPPA